MQDDPTRRRDQSLPTGSSAPPDRPGDPEQAMLPGGHIDPVALAAWLDGPDELPAVQRVAVADHLAACASCRATLEELRLLVAALARLPEAVPARSFTLTPTLAGRQPLEAPATAPVREPVRLHERHARAERQLTVLRWATAIAAALLVVALSASLLSSLSGPAGDDEDAEAPAAGAAVEMAAPTDAARSAATSAEPGTAAPTAAAVPATAGVADVSQTPQATAGVEPTPTPETSIALATGEPTPAGEEAVTMQAPPEATATTPALASEATAASQPPAEPASVRGSNDGLWWTRAVAFGLAVLLVTLVGVLTLLSRRARRL